jgi:hypothetical protein
MPDWWPFTNVESITWTHILMVTVAILVVFVVAYVIASRLTRR